MPDLENGPTPMIEQFVAALVEIAYAAKPASVRTSVADTP
jgi:hypothetical protein